MCIGHIIGGYWIGVTTAGCVTVVITLPVTQRPVSHLYIHSAIFIMTGGRVSLLLALLLGCCHSQSDNSTAVPSTNTTAAVAANTTTAADAATSATASNATTTTAATTETTTREETNNSVFEYYSNNIRILSIHIRIRPFFRNE